MKNKKKHIKTHLMKMGFEKYACYTKLDLTEIPEIEYKKAEEFYKQLFNYAEIAKSAFYEVKNYFETIKTQKRDVMTAEQFINSRFKPYGQFAFDIWKETVMRIYEREKQIYNKIFFGVDYDIDKRPHFCMPIDGYVEIDENGDICICTDVLCQKIRFTDETYYSKELREKLGNSKPLDWSNELDICTMKWIYEGDGWLLSMEINKNILISSTPCTLIFK